MEDMHRSEINSACFGTENCQLDKAEYNCQGQVLGERVSPKHSTIKCSLRKKTNRIWGHGETTMKKEKLISGRFG